jgi:hypothetical protein
MEAPVDWQVPVGAAFSSPGGVGGMMLDLLPGYWQADSLRLLHFDQTPVMHRQHDGAVAQTAQRQKHLSQQVALFFAQVLKVVQRLR